MRARPNISGLSPVEQSILDLWDRGFSFGQIAVQLGIKPKRVSHVVSQFNGAGEHLAERQMMANGSADLLSALRRTGVCA